MSKVNNYISTHKHDYGLPFNTEYQSPIVKIKLNIYLISLICSKHHIKDRDLTVNKIHFLLKIYWRRYKFLVFNYKYMSMSNFPSRKIIKKETNQGLAIFSHLVYYIMGKRQGIKSTRPVILSQNKKEKNLWLGEPV